MYTFALVWAWLAALGICMAAWPTATRNFIIAIGCWLLIFGCAADTRTPDEIEYDRVEWTETVLIPAINACEAHGGIIMWVGPYSQRIRRILDTGNWRALNRTDWHSVRCMERY